MIDIRSIKKLVGDVTAEEIRNVDCYTCGNFGIFIPSVGPCYYAIKSSHTHPAYSFIYNYDDNGKVRNSKKELINSNPGCFTVFSPDVPHEEILSEEFSRYIAIMINRFFFEEEFKIYSNKKIPVFDADIFGASHGIIYLCREFMLESENRMPGRERLMESAGLRLTHAIVRSILGFKDYSENISMRFNIDRVIEHMNLCYSDKLTVDKLASIANLSPSHFFKIFKGQTGKSPLDYLIDLRLEKAKKQLIIGEKSMTEIAFSCGFSNSGHFSTAFGKKFKTSPTEYRNILNRIQ